MFRVNIKFTLASLGILDFCWNHDDDDGDDHPEGAPATIVFY